MSKTWLITGVSSGFGYEMTRQLLDVTDVPAVQKTVAGAFERHGKVDVVISNAGYGLFGCAEELTDEH